jgi:enoyl-CoA hydratase/carnithine racemase
VETSGAGDRGAARVTDVLVERRGAVEVITLNRPERKNAFGGSLFGDVLEAAEAADRAPEVGAIVTTGAGRAYCVGADLAELDKVARAGPIDLGVLGVGGLGGDKGLPEQSPAQVQADHLGIGRWSMRFFGIGVPTIAAINGAAAGGGLALALLHDVRIGSREAKLAPALIRLGLAPEMGMTWLVPRMLGTARAFDVLTRATPIEADEALSLGLLDAVVEPSELLDAAIARAQALASLPAGAIRATKRLVQQAPASTFEAQLEREWMTQRQLFASAETAALIDEALQRWRKPSS